MGNLWIFVLACVPFAHSEIRSGEFETHGCPDGWVVFEESCYLFDVEQTFDWTEAGHFCSNHFSSNLVIIDSKEEHSFLKYFLRKFATAHRNTYYWIGATDDELEGRWIWYTDHHKVSASYHEWGPNEPDNVANQDCGCLVDVFDWKMGDNHCNAKERVICEKK